MKTAKRFIAFFAIFPLWVWAGDGADLVQSFPQDCQKTLKALIENNGAQVGNLNARQLLQDSEKISWSAKSEGQMAGSGDNRLSAEHLIEEKRVTFSLQNLQLTPYQSRFLVSFHECISANGIQDEQYQVTSSALLKLIPKSNFEDPRKFPKGTLEKVEQQLKGIELRQKNPIYQRSGGGTSVGGGGDGTAINFKISALLFVHPLVLKFPELFRHSSLDLLQKIIDSGFELSVDPQVSSLTFERKGIVSVIRLPMSRWLDGYKETRGITLSIDQWRMLLEALQLLDQTMEQPL